MKWSQFYLLIGTLWYLLGFTVADTVIAVCHFVGAVFYGRQESKAEKNG